MYTLFLTYHKIVDTIVSEKHSCFALIWTSEALDWTSIEQANAIIHGCLPAIEPSH